MEEGLVEGDAPREEGLALSVHRARPLHEGAAQGLGLWCVRFVKKGNEGVVVWIYEWKGGMWTFWFGAFTFGHVFYLRLDGERRGGEQGRQPPLLLPAGRLRDLLFVVRSFGTCQAS